MVGKRILELRKKAGLSQEALAHEAGLPPVTVWRLESGHYKQGAVRTLQAIARALSKRLGVPEWAILATLMDEPEEETPQAIGTGGR